MKLHTMLKKRELSELTLSVIEKSIDDPQGSPRTLRFIRKNIFLGDLCAFFADLAVIESFQRK